MACLAYYHCLTNAFLVPNYGPMLETLFSASLNWAPIHPGQEQREMIHSSLSLFAEKILRQPTYHGKKRKNDMQDSQAYAVTQGTFYVHIQITLYLS